MFEPTAVLVDALGIGVKILNAGGFWRNGDGLVELVAPAFIVGVNPNVFLELDALGFVVVPNDGVFPVVLVAKALNTFPPVPRIEPVVPWVETAGVVLPVAGPVPVIACAILGVGAPVTFAGCEPDGDEVILVMEG